MYFLFLEGLGSPEGFQGVLGGRGYILTKFGPDGAPRPWFAKYNDLGIYFPLFSYVPALNIRAKDSQVVLEACPTVQEA